MTANHLTQGVVLVLNAVLWIGLAAESTLAQTPPSPATQLAPTPPPEPKPPPSAAESDESLGSDTPPASASFASDPMSVPTQATSSELAAPEVDLNAYMSDDGTAAAIADAEGPSLRLYGFADFKLGYNAESSLSPILGESPVFAIGNLNLYAAADLDERWRSLAEIRFTYLPNGALNSDLSRVSTTTEDSANIGAYVRWGGVNIERVWLEYSAHELITVRLGQWLTPVGIWNVDHGSPTIIPALRPYVINASLFPTSQTGLELYGSRLFGETTIGYHLTISNGRGSADTYLELDKNKGVGGRLYVTLVPLGRLTIGASVYRGQSTEGRLAVAGTALVSQITTQYDEVGVAADVLWQLKGLHLQVEIFSQDVVYTNSGRAPVPLPIVGGLTPDNRRTGGYVLAGYRLPWLTLMPFIEFDFIDNGGSEVTQPGGPHAALTYTAGLNARPIPSVVLKAQWLYLTFEAEDGREVDSFHSFQCQAAWSF